MEVRDLMLMVSNDFLVLGELVVMLNEHAPYGMGVFVVPFWQ